METVLVQNTRKQYRLKEIKTYYFNAVLTFEDSHRRVNIRGQPQERTVASRRQSVPSFFLSKCASTKAVAKSTVGKYTHYSGVFRWKGVKLWQQASWKSLFSYCTDDRRLSEPGRGGLMDRFGLPKRLRQLPLEPRLLTACMSNRGSRLGD